ncbi:hypothetical protein H0H81_000527 [Sphagnurus paluster]|uniref:Uncharacterized protein n=1 Tax=Sphagnurus paluster TaxID=117069 RepID=A0A9P7KNC7_9AGAR|nr:hypothetical protein H0H81_000527 [Sphagnurus paluster]
MGKAADLSGGVTDTGARFDKARVRRYVEEYLPPSYLEKPEGQDLLRRACYWLEGRPRFTAAYVQFLIEHGLQAPHQVLSRYITDITRFTPMDGGRWEEEERKLYVQKKVVVARCPFDCIRAENQNGTRLLEAVRKITYHRMMNGNIDFVTGGLGIGETAKKLVECGFARFPGITTSEEAIIDEPLAYLAVEHWIATRQGVTQRHEYFAQHFATNSITLSGNGLELYIASCLAETFKEFTPLSSHIPLSKGFHFTERGTTTDLNQKRARLVSRWIDAGGKLCVAPVVYPFDALPKPGDMSETRIKSPSHILCYRSGKVWKDDKLVDDIDGDIQWLEGKVNAPFLLPNTNFGPDLMMCLELEGTQEFIWVAVQVKLKSKSVAGVRLIKQSTQSSNGKPFSPKGYPDIEDITAQALTDGLPRPYMPSLNIWPRFPPEPPYRSLLRVIFIFPAEVMTQDVKVALDSLKPDPHDLVSIPFSSMHDCDCILKNYKDQVRDLWLKKKRAPSSPLSVRRNPPRLAKLGQQPYPATTPSTTSTTDLDAMDVDFDTSQLITDYSIILKSSRSTVISQLKLFRRYEETVINKGRTTPSKKFKTKPPPAGDGGNLDQLREDLTLSAVWYNLVGGQVLIN